MMKPRTLLSKTQDMLAAKEITQPIKDMETDSVPPMVRLENWKRCDDHYNSPCLEGDVYDHPHIQDGYHVYTSPLCWISEGSMLAQTKSRLYALGRKAA